MNGLQHLPEYASAAQSYRLERTQVERAPRHTAERRHPLRHLVAALMRRPATTPVPATR